MQALKATDYITYGKYTIVPIDILEENTRNPNKMDKGNFNQLVKSLIKDNGNGNGPILVRKSPDNVDKLQVIDGAHRYRAMKEAGFLDIIVEIVEVSDKDARLQTISMNLNRGAFDQILLAQLLFELKTKYNMLETDIQEELGYSDDELKTYNSFVDFDFEQMDANLEINQEQPISLLDTLEINMTESQLAFIEGLRKELNMVNDTDYILIAKYFIAKQDEIKDIQAIKNFVANI